MPIRILHITDLHILADPSAKLFGVNTYEALEAVLDAALSVGEAPAVIIATGDLSQDGSPGSYARLRQLFLATGLPVHTVPGNHDDAGAMRAGLIGGRISMNGTHDANGWKFVFLNSQIQGESAGRIKPDELAALRTDIENSPDTPFLIALHHSPLDPCPHKGCQLEDGSDVLTMLQEAGNVRALLAGHAHIEAMSKHGSLCVMTTPATCFEAWHAQTGEAESHEDFAACHRIASRRHGYRQLDLMPDGTIHSEVCWL